MSGWYPDGPRRAPAAIASGASPVGGSGTAALKRGTRYRGGDDSNAAGGSLTAGLCGVVLVEQPQRRSPARIRTPTGVVVVPPALTARRGHPAARMAGPNCGIEESGSRPGRVLSATRSGAAAAVWR